LFDPDRCRELPFKSFDFEYRPMLSQTPSRLFLSAKTSTSIPAGSRIVLDALVQATLDPQVRSLGFVQTATVGAAQVALETIVVVRDDGRYYLDVVEARPVRGVEAEGLALIALRRLDLKALTLTSADIRKEPGFTNANTVWRYRMNPVGIVMRLKVLTVLLDEGPLRLGCLLKRIDVGRDPAPPIMAMACSDLIELDLASQALGPATIVRSRT
jgi:hypothetical protein